MVRAMVTRLYKTKPTGLFVRLPSFQRTHPFIFHISFTTKTPSGTMLRTCALRIHVSPSYLLGTSSSLPVLLFSSSRL
ncbi:hypothetical protein I308_104979 [Cryptococcus tetragattii IND107]|uniref:Uncharacterized protein n=1 Tax=Cryptococcus tetragattii IND107 TaxID=1296105 RepID=A0ABR3BP35_9TREE